MFAAACGHVPMVELLLRIKADLNAVDVRINSYLLALFFVLDLDVIFFVMIEYGVHSFDESGGKRSFKRRANSAQPASQPKRSKRGTASHRI